MQLETMAKDVGADPERIAKFKDLALDTMLSARRPDMNLGTLLDSKYGRQALFRAEKEGLWIGRPVELPGSRPLQFEGAPSLGAEVASWPDDHVIKCLVFYNPDDPEALRRQQLDQLHRLASAARLSRHEFLIEVIGTAEGKVGEMATSMAMQQMYDEGIRPDWWKLTDQTKAGWAAISAVIESNDRWCRGILLLGLDATFDELESSITRATGSRHVRGFAIGRTIFGDAARAWLANEIDDATAQKMMKERFERLIGCWTKARRMEAA